MARDPEREEAETVCADCKEDVGVDPSLIYEAGNGVRLCWECALGRGGTFDARKDRWVALPDISDLPDERRPHP